MKIPKGQICMEEGCHDLATEDYNGHEHFVCSHHDRRLNDYFDEEYNWLTLLKTNDMILTKKQLEEFEEAAKPMMEYLGKNCHPYVTVIIDNGSAEIMESSARITSDEFIPD